MTGREPTLKPIVQEPRYKQAARRIAESILSGELPRGSKMPTERQLVDLLGVSRPTVREAMIALEISGFVENRFGTGAFVASNPPYSSQLTNITDPGPFELLEARMLIEGEIAFIAAQHVTCEEIAHLRDCIERMRDESGKAFWSTDAEFHISVAGATRNTAFVNVVREFWRQRTRMPMWVRMHDGLAVDDVREEIMALHSRVVDALAAGDQAGSREAMREHLRDFGRSLLEKWRSLEQDMRGEINPPNERLVRQLD